MGEALIVQRDALVQSATITPNAGQQNSRGSTGRMLSLDPAYRAAVVHSELTEEVRVEVSTDEKEVTVLSSTTGSSSAPICKITRPELDDFERDSVLVADYADLRDDRLPEIDIQIHDQLSFFGAVTPLQPARYRWTLEMLSAALDWASMLGYRVKLGLGCPRPELFTPLIQPVIQTPNHDAFPSGHSTQSHMVAALLTSLRFPQFEADPLPLTASPDERVLQLYRVAARIAINRTVAGVHYPSDSASGAMIGISLARLLVARARNALKEGSAHDATATGYDFDGSTYKHAEDDGTERTRDYDIDELAKMLPGDAAASPFKTPLTPLPAPLFAVLWKKASEEWDNRWG